MENSKENNTDILLTLYESQMVAVAEHSSTAYNIFNWSTIAFLGAITFVLTQPDHLNKPCRIIITVTVVLLTAIETIWQQINLAHAKNHLSTVNAIIDSFEEVSQTLKKEKLKQWHSLKPNAQYRLIFYDVALLSVAILTIVATWIV